MLSEILMAAIRSAADINVNNLLIQLSFNMLFVWGIVQFLYYRKARRAEYYFTFMLISMSVFFVILLLSSVKMKLGFALGLFSVFSILRYRTVQLPVREMTYLFVLITMSVLNAMGTQMPWDVRVLCNVSFVVVLIIGELILSKQKGVKYIKYDRIDLCKKSKRSEMIADIEERLELEVIDVQIGSVNFLKDMALVKIWYRLDKNETADEEITKIPQE